MFGKTLLYRFYQGKKDREVEERVTDLLNLIGLTDKALLFPINFLEVKHNESVLLEHGLRTQNNFCR
jgi:hypothetical protein